MVRSPSSDPTPPQRRILDHLLKRDSEGGPPPTYREIAAALGWRAPGTVRDHVRALERKGLLVSSRLARGLRLTGAGREAAGRGDRSPNPPSETLSSFFGEAGKALEPLAPHFHPRRFPAGTVLWRAGESPSMIVAIETGHIKVYRTLPGGTVAAFYLFGPGELFGFLPFLDGRPYPATAEAIDDVRARTMSREGPPPGAPGKSGRGVAAVLFSRAAPPGGLRPDRTPLGPRSASPRCVGLGRPAAGRRPRYRDDRIPPFRFRGVRPGLGDRPGKFFARRHGPCGSGRNSPPRSGPVPGSRPASPSRGSLPRRSVNLPRKIDRLLRPVNVVPRRNLYAYIRINE